ncbi:acyl-CoA dehydrogenase family protein [Roseibacterium sp. SDUM158017]|uniref:acyl-CoA dehydrogenase family protein n=1 Tax=Roseicyclus salinarum TaxID=3036773 RepID=UPI0024150620|nr:acyl-CoA dehydrogenase family protein [Roseibacterium sp. SDUM158017]MDG4649999.1 acyl-CoA dehydrogenase family protein [Roseibacterium sp. SDUM158017]
MKPESDLGSHEVTNQPPPRGDRDLWQEDPVLRTHAAGADVGGLARKLGSLEAAGWGREANRRLPELRLFDAGGRRLDEVVFSDAYHRLMTLGLEAGYASGPWTGGSHLTHAATVYLMSQVEPGSCCPMTMTYAAVPALQAAAPSLAEVWVPKLTAAAYDPAVAPLSAKRAATLGMAMTEKQGGSDVRSNATRAEREGEAWRLMGHKWFCSAPMSDGFLTLARTEAGVSCFLVPRWLEDGTRNAVRLQRLKDKLGNRANASAEIEYHGARAHLVGEEGRGIPAIMAMVHHTRLDTGLAPAGLMRAALDHLSHWVLHRTAFQRRLADQPLMRALLADLVLDWEGATALGFHVARAFDDPARAPFARIAVALAKYVNNKLAPRVVVEAMEGLGGMGYVEDTPLPMLYREAPLNGIWEGSGNVICLDILRTLAREPEAGGQLAAELDAAIGADRRYDAALEAHRARWPRAPREAEARWFAERLALLLAASVLLRHAPAAVAEAFVATRLAGDRGQVAGSIAPADAAPILARLGPGFR